MTFLSISSNANFNQLSHNALSLPCGALEATKSFKLTLKARLQMSVLILSHRLQTKQFMTNAGQ